jgi:hypothetical protein
VLTGFTLTSHSTFWEVVAKMVVMGLGLGPSIPLFTLAIQNAVQPQKIGVATASATFFRQMGSTIGVAILGSVFANVVSNDITPRMDTIKATLPAAMQSQFTTGAGGGFSGEGSSSNGFDATKIKANIEKNIKAGFETQYQAIAGAINSGKPEAFKALLANPQLPAPLKAQLSSIPTVAIADPGTRVKILAGIKANQAPAIQQTTTTAFSAIDKVGEAIKESFTAGITTVYKLGILIALLALLITAFIPELPLRAGARHAPAAE